MSYRWTTPDLLDAVIGIAVQELEDDPAQRAAFFRRPSLDADPEIVWDVAE